MSALLKRTSAPQPEQLSDAVQNQLLRYGIDLEPSAITTRLVVHSRPVDTWCELTTTEVRS